MKRCIIYNVTWKSLLLCYYVLTFTKLNKQKQRNEKIKDFGLDVIRVRDPLHVMQSRFIGELY